MIQQMLIAAESKREEEKAKGASNADDNSDNPDIVLFDDNEEEEEEESDEEEDGTLGSQGRGRGRGMFWQPPMPVGRGGRPVLGVRGFPPVMMGMDGFSYGPVGPDGFTAQDIFGGPPRLFPPYGGPRFPSDFSGAGHMPGFMFPGRPPQPGLFQMGGLGMMMGSGRAFMGGMPMAGIVRPNRPMGIPPFLQPQPPHSNWAPKREQRRSGSDQGNKAQETSGQDDETGYGYQQGSRAPIEDRFTASNRYAHDDSESEDETAPRRSRHGENSKKRRGTEGEAAADHWDAPESSNL